MVHPKVAACALVLAALLCGGCKEKPDRSDEDLKSIEKADKALMAQERSLLSRRGALQRERTRIRDKRAELLTKRAALSEGDQVQREELEKEESQLATLEAKLVKQEIGLNDRLQSLIDEKSGLVEKLAKGKGDVKQALVARREYGVALREKDLARRESDLSRRERDLARREQALAMRQAKLCPRASSTVQVIQAPPRSGGASYTRQDVEPVYRAAVKAMGAKGILTADLPPGIDRLMTEIRHAVSKKDYTRGKYAADQLLATVRSMRVDREFIGAKIGRLGAAIRRSPPKGGNKNKVDLLFQQATASYGDGRFMDANRKLNRIYGLLK
jgi:hypothetical protein